MGTLLGLKYIPYTYMDPLGNVERRDHITGSLLRIRKLPLSGASPANNVSRVRRENAFPQRVQVYDKESGCRSDMLLSAAFFAPATRIVG